MNALTISSPSITSAEIAELVQSRHDSVKRTIERLAGSGVIVQPPLVDEHGVDAAGRPRTTQVFRFVGERGKRDSIVVVAQLSPEFTARLVDRWQQLEAQVAMGGFAIPRSMPEALRLAADLAEQKAVVEAKVLTLEQRIESEAPLVAFAKQVEVAPDAISVGEAAKIIGTGRNRLFSFMREIGWLTRRSEPYQEMIERGYLDVKIGEYSSPRDGGLRERVTPLVKGKGLAKLQQLWATRLQQQEAA